MFYYFAVRIGLILLLWNCQEMNYPDWITVNNNNNREEDEKMNERKKI